MSKEVSDKDNKAIKALKAIKMYEPHPEEFSFYSQYIKQAKVYIWFMDKYNTIMKELTPLTTREMCKELNKIEIDYIAKPQKWSVVEVNGSLKITVAYPCADGSYYTEFLSDMSFNNFSGYPELQKKLGLYFSNKKY